jgi:hypothetical protein
MRGTSPEKAYKTPTALHYHYAINFERRRYPFFSNENRGTGRICSAPVQKHAASTSISTTGPAKQKRQSRPSSNSHVQKPPLYASWAHRESRRKSAFSRVVSAAKDSIRHDFCHGSAPCPAGAKIGRACATLRLPCEAAANRGRIVYENQHGLEPAGLESEVEADPTKKMLL